MKYVLLSLLTSLALMMAFFFLCWAGYFVFCFFNGHPTLALMALTLVWIGGAWALHAWDAPHQ